MVRDVGKCIYCGKTPAQFVLTKEHIVPHSLGGDAYLKRASCAKCQEITRDLEFHVARNIFGHFRIHSEYKHVYIQKKGPI